VRRPLECRGRSYGSRWVPITDLDEWRKRGRRRVGATDVYERQFCVSLKCSLASLGRESAALLSVYPFQDINGQSMHCNITTQMSEQIFSIEAGRLQIQICFLNQYSGLCSITWSYSGRERLQLRYCDIRHHQFVRITCWIVVIKT
jgi:hypothetical protein